MVPVPWIWYQYHLCGTGHQCYFLFITYIAYPILFLVALVIDQDISNDITDDEELNQLGEDTDPLAFNADNFESIISKDMLI